MAKKKAAKKKAARKKAPRKKAPRKKVVEQGGSSAGRLRGGAASLRGGEGLSLEWVAAGELSSHPANWRRHPPSQRAAFESLLEEVGWCGYILFNRATGRVLDGHMRKNAVPPETVVPVLMGEWSEAEERLILATFNPIGSSAGVDEAKGRALLEEVESEVPGVQAVLEGLERSVAKLEREAARKRPEDRVNKGEEDGAGEGREVSGGRAKPLRSVTNVMVKCRDEGDQLMVLAKLRAAGFKVKRAECV